MKMLIVLSSLLFSFSTYAASNQDIHDCVVKSKAAGSDTFAMHSIAQQCAGVQNVALLQQCVDETRHQDGFYAGDAATVCAGVKDLPALRQCLKQERADGFNDEELALLCTQH